MVQRGKHLHEMHRSLGGFPPKPIGRTDHLPVFHSAPGKERAGDAGPMVAAAVLVDLRRSAELSPDADCHILIQAAVVQVLNQSRDALIKHRHVLAGIAVIVSVPIPKTECHRHHPHAGLHQPTRHKELFKNSRRRVTANRLVALAVHLDCARVLF